MRKAARDLFRRHARLGCAVNLYAIAGRKHERFGATGMAQQAVRFAPACETLARFHIRAMMTQADAKKVHGIECNCALKVMPHKSVSAALKATMQSAATRFGASQRRYFPCKIAA